MPKIKVLIIESHPAVQKALTTRLKADPDLDIVGTADDTGVSSHLIRKQQPHVVLYGIHNKSDKNIHQTAATIQNMTHNKTSVIVLAPYADTVEKDMLLKAGAKRYLLKHIDTHQLIQEIEDVAPASD